MYSAEVAVAAIGAELDGVVPTMLAEKRGVDHDARKHLRSRGVLVKVCRGVDRLRDHPVTWRTRCRIALAAAGDGAVLGLRTAARLHGFYSYRSRPEIEVVVLRGLDHDVPHTRVMESRWLPPDHVTVVDGLPVTTVARTFFDLCGDPDGGMRVAHPAHEQKMSRVYNDAVARRGLSFHLEAAVLLVMARRGRAGTQLVRTLLLRFGPKYKPTQSEAESLFYELVLAYGLPEPDKQVAISGDRGFIGVVDFLWRAVLHVVEVDSRWHDGPLDEEHDEERDAELEAAGYTVGRYRYGQMVERPAAIARELAVIVGSRDPTTTANSQRVRGAR